MLSVRAPRAEAVWLGLFDTVTGAETRVAMTRNGDDWQTPAPPSGTHYGLRAAGAWAPDQGLWFDPSKLLVDPRAVALDRRFSYHPDLATYGVDTAAIVPRAIWPGALPEVPRARPIFTQGGLIYELHVKGYTRLHPDIPQALRGTVAALAHPSVIAHLKRLHVVAVELMPIVAWLDERHLPPLGLTNYWGYNPIAMMALDPGLCPGGWEELRATVAALHAAGIGVILDLVFNHSAESDRLGPVIGLRGLDNGAYAHGADGALVNVTGCGNTLDFAQSSVRALVLDSLRHFVRHAGVDGFRFDLAPVMARGPEFSRNTPIFAEIAADPWLADRVLIAEPWDIGEGGYRLGQFPGNWLEWNDRFRDDVRSFWRRASDGDGARVTGVGTLATRMAGSADIFGEQTCRSVNFLAAHDGFTLADTVAYVNRHNEANGENNRDGHGDNRSWNCGVEGVTDDPAILAERARDLRALLATLFASTGTIMLTAGDEFGRSQQGNNNAYCQDNAIGWVDWAARDTSLEDYVAQLAAWRAAHVASLAQFPRSGHWTRPDGTPVQPQDWDDPQAPGIAYVSTDPDRPLDWRIDHAQRVVMLDGPPLSPA